MSGGREETLGRIYGGRAVDIRGEDFLYESGYMGEKNCREGIWGKNFDPKDLRERFGISREQAEALGDLVKNAPNDGRDAESMWNKLKDFGVEDEKNREILSSDENMERFLGNWWQFKNLWDLANVHKREVRSWRAEAKALTKEEGREAEIEKLMGWIQASEGDENRCLGGALANLTFRMAERPWVEQRKVKEYEKTIAREEVPLFERRSRPFTYNQPFEYPKQFFNARFNPALPSAEQRKHFEKVEFQEAPPVDEKDLPVWEIIKRALRPTGIDPEIWRNWALATKILGLDDLVERNQCIYTELLDRAQNRISTKKDLQNKKENIVDEITARDGVPYPNGFAADRYWHILSAFRYDQDHSLKLYEFNIEDWLSAYSELFYMMETSYCQPLGEEEGLFALVNSLAVPLMGGRKEQFYPGKATSLIGYQYFDEVDGIFLLATHILGESGEGMQQIKNAWKDGNEPERYCLFPDHTEVNPIGAILMMGKLYFQMDDPLREAWRPILIPLIERAARAYGGQLGGVEPFLAMDGMVGENEGPEWERWKVEAVGVLETFTPPILRILSRSQPISGWGADRFEQIAHEEEKVERVNYGEEVEEYLRKEYWMELKPKSQVNPEEKPAEPEKTAIEILHEAGIKLTAEDRLHPKMAELVRAVEKDSEAGNLDKMGALKRVAERLTGRKIEDLDITQTIMALGQIKAVGPEMATAGRETAPALIFEAQEGNNSFWNMDLATKMLVILRAGNRLPKALIVEQLIQSLGGGAEIAMMRVALAVEKLIRDQRPWETGEEQFVFPVFTGREKLAKAEAKFGKNSAQYRRGVIRTFAEFLGITQVYHDYEGSVTDWLSFMEVLEETGRPMSQCGELAQFAAEMQGWMAPDVKTNIAYRERFTGLSLKEWMDKLKSGEAEGTFDHLKVLSELPHHGEMIVDETIGKAYVTDGRVMIKNARRSAAMERGEYQRVKGEVAEMDYVGREAGREKVDEGFLIYDSRSELKRGPKLHFLGNIASNYPELKTYALAMAGDDPVVLRNLMYGAEDDGEKLKYLRRKMAMAPRQIADGFGAGEVGHQKTLVADVGILIRAGDYCQGLFVLQILKHKYGGFELRKEAEKLCESVINRLAVMAQEELAENLKLAKGSDLLLAEDEETIKKAWEKHQLGIKRMAKQKGVSQEEARRTIAGPIKMIMSNSFHRAEMAAIGAVDDYAPNGMGDKIKAEIQAEVQQAAQAYQRDHQIEKSDANPLLKDKFVELDPDGAGFAIAEITRGLSEQQTKEALIGVGVFLLAAEEDLGFSQLPDGVETLWSSVRAAVESRGLSLPFTRTELIANLPAAMARLKISGMTDKLLTDRLS